MLSAYSHLLIQFSTTSGCVSLILLVGVDIMLIMLSTAIKTISADFVFGYIQAIDGEKVCIRQMCGELGDNILAVITVITCNTPV